MNSASVAAGLAARIVEFRVQASDHPVAASCPETRYLTALEVIVN